MQTWEEATKWEADWHGNCVNSFGEEYKQLAYAKYMGLKLSPNEKTLFRFDLEGKSVLDIGGGPYSLLLKCENFSLATIVDPCDYPGWVNSRYETAGIVRYKSKGEDLPESLRFDEVWIYNCLQHTEDPAKIIANARKIGKIIRVFEWIENGVSNGHLHNLSENDLNQWLGGIGKVSRLDDSQRNLKGYCYYGIFKGAV